MQYADPTRYIALWRPEEPAAPASRHIQVTTRNRARFVLSRPFLASTLACNTKVPVDPAASPNDIVAASAVVKRFGEVIQKVSVLSSTRAPESTSGTQEGTNCCAANVLPSVFTHITVCRHYGAYGCRTRTRCLETWTETSDIRHDSRGRCTPRGTICTRRQGRR